MFHYGNLSDADFEDLCRDVMSRKLGVTLRSFARGRDGGVDLTDDTVEKNIVVQVKHYQESDKSALIRSLKNERRKVQDLQPRKYYICCSKDLTCANIADLRQHFREYMFSDDHIITRKDLDSFLSDPANQDILKKHFKLWIESTGILEEIFNDAVFVDSDALLADIEEDTKRFVPTTAFEQALEYLNKNRILCIIGNPGVGKSITSKMLVLHYAALGYRVRCTTDVADLRGLKEALSRDPHTREVILLDDCFGHIYFKMKSSQSTELLSLIKFVKMRTSKVLILNSRVTIFQEARSEHQGLIRSFEKGDFQVFILDMTDLRPVEKARILHNHLTMNGLPAFCLDYIRQDARYRKIIAHPNYTPRIIEFVCTPSRVSGKTAEAFYTFFLEQLNNPQQMWENEYNRKLQDTDRILLQTIYSLTDGTTELDLVRTCFENRIADMPSIDRTIDQFSASVRRLSGGFIRCCRFDSRDEAQTSIIYVGMINHSVNDFLHHLLTESPGVKREILGSICHIQQLQHMLSGKRLLRAAEELLRSQRIDALLFPSEADKQFFCFWTIASAKLQLEGYRSIIINYLSDPHLVSLYLAFEHYEGRCQALFQNLFSPEMWKFYDLNRFCSEEGNILSMLNGQELDMGIATIVLLDQQVRGAARKRLTEEGMAYLDEKLRQLWSNTARESLSVSHDWYEYDYDAPPQITDEDEHTEYLDEDDPNIRRWLLDNAGNFIDPVYLAYRAGYRAGGSLDQGDIAQFRQLLSEEVCRHVSDYLAAEFGCLPAEFLPIIDTLDQRLVSMADAQYVLEDVLGRPVYSEEFDYEEFDDPLPEEAAYTTADQKAEERRAIDDIFQR